VRDLVDTPGGVERHGPFLNFNNGLLQPHASRTTVGPQAGRARAGLRKTASLFPRSETSGLVGIRERPWSYSLGDAGQGGGARPIPIDHVVSAN